MSPEDDDGDLVVMIHSKPGKSVYGLFPIYSARQLNQKAHSASLMNTGWPLPARIPERGKQYLLN